MPLPPESTISNLVPQGESETLEFKTSFNDESLETIVAFANAQGGTLLIGVSDEGEISGIQLGKKTLEDWANRIKDSTDPRLQPSMVQNAFEQKMVVLIRIEPLVNGPASTRGRFFKRVGRTNQRMSHDEIKLNLLRGSGLSWDAVVEPQATLEDLDLAKVDSSQAWARGR